MKLRSAALLMSCALLVAPAITASAVTAEVGEQKPGSGDHTPGGGGGGGGEGEGPPPPPRIPEELLISPKVTALHSLNALLVNGINDGDNDLGVYFIPSLDDFPTSLKDTVACITDRDGIEHRFAVVYDGYFDSEVAYEQAEAVDGDTGMVARLQTSKKVYSSVDNTRALNLIGYDLLLSNEELQLDSDGDWLKATYNPTLVGTNQLTAQTVIMDLYKAIGEYEWDIKYCWVKDDDLLLETSPIQSEMGVAISDKYEKGINTDEGATYVWATRTNPKLYWDRCKKDAVFDGGAHSVTHTQTASFVGSQVSVSFGKSEGDTVTFGEFCAMARAIMDLYGEPVMTVAEQQIMIQNYGLNLPSCKDTELFDSVCYLAAKGIIDPSEVSYDKNVTFADIEPILVRIADVDSRLTFKEANYNKSSELYQKGYVSASTQAVSGELTNVDTLNSDVTTEYNDFFIQCDDNVTNFLLSPADTLDDPTDDILASDNLLCNGIESSSVDGFDYTFQNLGVEENFYHFKINSNVGAVTISYERDVSRSEFVQNRDSYTLPNANGGVYIVNGETLQWYSFDEAAGQTYMVGKEEHVLPEYSMYYVDNDRRTNSEVNQLTDFGYMSDWNWIVCSFDDTAHQNMGNYTLYDQPLTDLTPMVAEEVLMIPDGSNKSPTGDIMVKYCPVTEANVTTHNYVFQCPYDQSAFTSHFSDKSAVQGQSSNAFYCPTADEVLVSYDYLVSKGLVKSCSINPDKTRCIITLKNGSTNVILDKDMGTILVGCTLYKIDNNEMLFTESNGVLYINYRACIGWTTDVLVLNNQGNLMLTQAQIGRRSTVNRYNISAKTCFPSSSFQVGGASYSGKKYVNLANTSPMGNYLLVMDTSGSNTDHLFIWKRKEYVLPGSSDVQVLDGDARATFQDKTGYSLSASDDYILLHTALPRNAKNISHVGQYYYLITAGKASNGIRYQKEYGWWYEPKTYSNVDEAFKDYLSCDTGDQLSIAQVGNSYFNTNINFCSINAQSDPLPAGTMPKAYTQGAFSKIGRLASAALNGTDPNAVDNNMSRFTGTGKYEDTGAQYEESGAFRVLPAPVGMFASLYKLPSKTLGTIGSRSIWYGSQKCTVRNNKLVLDGSGYIVESDPNKVLYAVYVGGGSSAIYVYGDESVGVNTVDESTGETTVNMTDTDPGYLVDWEAFTFGRLVTKLDDLSTIWLIFALNILPRIAMVFFFILMILSLIADMPFVKKFCHNVFDVYKFLTLGRITVDTVNLKKLFLQSIAALAVFFMIMDGVLFQFILWVARIFLELNQR